MKVRTDFVSNSSSGSFCIIGMDNETLIKAFIELHRDEIIENPEDEDCRYLKGEYGYGLTEHMGLVIVGADAEDVRYIGVPFDDDEPNLKYARDEVSIHFTDDMTLGDLKDMIVERFKEAGVKMERKYLKIIQGECSNEC